MHMHMIEAERDIEADPGKRKRVPSEYRPGPSRCGLAVVHPDAIATNRRGAASARCKGNPPPRGLSTRNAAEGFRAGSTGALKATNTHGRTGGGPSAPTWDFNSPPIPPHLPPQCVEIQLPRRNRSRPRFRSSLCNSGRAPTRFVLPTRRDENGGAPGLLPLLHLRVSVFSVEKSLQGGLSRSASSHFSRSSRGRVRRAVPLIQRMPHPSWCLARHRGHPHRHTRAAHGWARAAHHPTREVAR
jgi:hypothetical protein